MTKKITTVRMGPAAYQRLKTLAANWDMAVGDAIEGLLDFAESGKYINDADFNKRFDGLLETAMLNAGIEAFWEGAPEEESIKAEMAKRQAAYERYLEAKDRGRQVAKQFSERKDGHG